MAMVINNNISRRQNDIPLDSVIRIKRYNGIRWFCVGLGGITSFCSLAGIAYLLWNHTAARGILLPIGIFAVAVIAGLVDLILWLFRSNVLSQQHPATGKQNATEPAQDIQNRMLAASDITVALDTHPGPPAQYPPSKANEDALAPADPALFSPDSSAPWAEPTDKIIISEPALFSSDSSAPWAEPTDKIIISEEEAIANATTMALPGRSEGDPASKHISPGEYDKPTRQQKTGDDFASKHTFPGSFRYYVLPRDVDNIELSQDKLAYDHHSACYAVTDGVGTSFLPGRWAQIIAQHFVSLQGGLESPAEITLWLKECSTEWYKWVEEQWVPQARANSGQEDWSREIARGAATTLAGCAFSRRQLEQNGATGISVMVVGDAEFFLLSHAPTAGSVAAPGYWEYNLHYRLKYEDFGHMTEALATPPDRVMHDYKWVHIRKDIIASVGDCIVLTTDALAQWILSQINTGQDPWRELFSLSNREAFKSFVHYRRSTGEMETDDTTIMIIPLQGNPTEA